MAGMCDDAIGIERSDVGGIRAGRYGNDVAMDDASDCAWRYWLGIDEASER